jgi:1-pyrroline-5-carboxylate dehydrogenase
MGKITYATMSADDPALHQAFEEGLASATEQIGQTHPLLINGQKRFTEETYTERSPIDAELVVGIYSQASDADVDDAVAVAQAFQPEWEATPWQERVAIVRRAAEIADEETPVLAGFLSLEIGKTRLEALGDVSEAVAFANYYCDHLEESGGLEKAMGAYGVGDTNSSVLRPWGVWAIISPFNFPMALVASPTSAALLTGNTVVLKPSNTGALGSLLLADIFFRAGLPAGALQVITGGDEAGDRLAHSDDVDGVTFTGSYDVGMYLYRTVAASRPKPVVCEMGGKNPAVVASSADLDLAAEGVMRAAFGLSGQKCSANSRVYVEPPRSKSSWTC